MASRRHLSDSSVENAGAMDDRERLRAQLAMFVSGSKGWIDAAKGEGLDEDVIEEVKEAHQHAREAFQILNDRKV